MDSTAELNRTPFLELENLDYVKREESDNPIWKYFSFAKCNDGKISKCEAGYPSKLYKIAGGSTRSLWRHLESAHKNHYEEVVTERDQRSAQKQDDAAKPKLQSIDKFFKKSKGLDEFVARLPERDDELSAEIRRAPDRCECVLRRRFCE